MIKALIFDCFGVLLTDTWALFRDRYFADKPAQLREAQDASKAVDLGLISWNEFRTAISRISGVSVADTYQMLDAKIVLDMRVLDTIRYYKTRYKIGMLSNIPSDRLENFLSSEQKELFDDLALSYSTGLLKPDPNAYEVAATRLGVQPSECLFIDDQQRNIGPARELGMKTIHYVDFAQFERELKELLQ